jgi:hypothetical protein
VAAASLRWRNLWRPTAVAISLLGWRVGDKGELVEVRSWHQVPAGSIEDDDILADAAMCDPRAWDKIKDKVLRGWERRDGRLFQVVVTTIAELVTR